MSAYPTCPTHGLLKPCPHCEPSIYAAPKVEDVKVCGDVEQGDVLVKCTCGMLRSKERSHGYTDRSPSSTLNGWRYL